MTRGFLLMCVVLVACGAGEGEETPNVCVHDPPLTYSNFGQGFMEKNCTGCHHSLLPPDQRNGAPVGIDFDTYTAVLDYADRVAARSLGESPSMPPTGSVPSEDLTLLAEWLSCQVAADNLALSEVEP